MKRKRLSKLGADLLSNVGLAAALPGDPIPLQVNLNTEVPIGFFEEAAKLPIRTQCRGIGGKKECMGTTCTPGAANKHAESLFLLPGEETFLRREMEKAGIEWKWNRDAPRVLFMEEACPYHQEDDTCGIKEFMPFVCRSYPLRAHKGGEDSLVVMSAIACPFHVGVSQEAQNDPHYNAWTNAWRVAMQFIPEHWWVEFKRSVPQGYMNLFNAIGERDLAAGRLPISTIVKWADKDCRECEGAGFTVFDNEKRLCETCMTTEKKQRIMSSLSSRKRRLKANWDSLKKKQSQRTRKKRKGRKG